MNVKLNVRFNVFVLQFDTGFNIVLNVVVSSNLAQDIINNAIRILLLEDVSTEFLKLSVGEILHEIVEGRKRIVECRHNDIIITFLYREIADDLSPSLARTASKPKSLSIQQNKNRNNNINNKINIHNKTNINNKTNNQHQMNQETK